MEIKVQDEVIENVMEFVYLGSRARPSFGFGAETAKFLGFGLVSVTAVTCILVSAWFRLRP